MTDETTDTLTDPNPADVPATEVVASEPAATAAPVAVAIPFWQRPHVERYLVPLVLPIAVVVGLVIFVLNLSRVFLSGHGHIPTIVGSILTAVILLGATIFSNATRLRATSIALMTTLFALTIFTSGWLVLGHSAEQGEASTPLAAKGPFLKNLDFKSGVGGQFKFAPVSLSVTTGVYQVTLTDATTGSHTLDFDDPKTLLEGLAVATTGQTDVGRIFFGEPGEYTYFCAIPGHRAGGMQGTVTVTGPSMTLEQAETAAGGGAAPEAAA
jgi:plastocyanin